MMSSKWLLEMINIFVLSSNIQFINFLFSSFWKQKKFKTIEIDAQNRNTNHPYSTQNRILIKLFSFISEKVISNSEVFCMMISEKVISLHYSFEWYSISQRIFGKDQKYVLHIWTFFLETRLLWYNEVFSFLKMIQLVWIECSNENPLVFLSSN